MAGYIAMARVERGRVRALAWDASAPADRVPDPGRAAKEPAAQPAVAASLQPDDGVPIREQWDRLRDQLSMVTFYLTDPESWR